MVSLVVYMTSVTHCIGDKSYDVIIEVLVMFDVCILIDHL
jgi:hypothetical protein